MSGNRTWPVAAVAAGLVALAALIGCGREESVAGRSAAAFEEAQKRGETSGGAGHSHGEGHGGTPQEHDHSAMAHGGGQHAEGHSPAQGDAPHAGHGSPAAPGHDHAAAQPAAPGDAHDHAGHSQPAAPGQDHSGHLQAGAGTPSAPVAELPAEPASILRPDPLDAPAATSVLDAQRSAEMSGAGGHGGHGGHGAGTYRHVDAGRQTPGAGPQHHDHGAAPGQEKEQAALYACPMHPEVTSKSPGTCPKCGMTLVERREE